MRRTTVLLLVLLLAGCTRTEPPTPEPDEPRLRMLAIDGRWGVDEASITALLAEAGAPAPRGSLVFGEARAGERVVDYVGIDAQAASALGIPAPARGEAFAPAAMGIPEGEALDLRSHAWPVPYVATFFEMERTPQCARVPAAKLCFLEQINESEARLRLRVSPGARDAAFLPDLVELGPGSRPAFWNGTFYGPDGTAAPFTARALLEGAPAPAELPGDMVPGEWVITFVLEANGRRVASGAAGIVRIREPGYLWFDDRLQEVLTADGQARAVLANATPTSASVTIARTLPIPPIGDDIIVISFEDARALSGTTGPTAILVDLTRAQEGAIVQARGPEPQTLAIRAREIPNDSARARASASAGASASASDVLVFAAPHDVDLASLAAIPGAGAPELALAGRPPVGEPPVFDGEAREGPLLLLAHADGPPSWGLPPGGRWMLTADANDNLSRSRTLALGSPDITAQAIVTIRIEVGGGNATRTVVGIGGVTGGPSFALWTSAALVSGLGSPVEPRVILPLDAGADREAVKRAALEAWGPLGLAFDR